MIKKGIILAGGKGTRMSPLTKAVNKQLLPIHDKPLIFYPLSILMLAGIKDILIIVNQGQLNQYKKIIPDGKNYGIKINYLEQKNPNGLPEAFILGEKFIKNQNVCLILGDNFFYGQNLSKILKDCTKLKNGAKIINDVSALDFDQKALEVVAKLKKPLILNHSQGTPDIMQNNPKYRNVLLDIYDYFENKIQKLKNKNYLIQNIIIDPGIGFGKNLDHNLNLISNIGLFHSLGCPIMLGPSRKSFIGKVMKNKDSKNRLGGTLSAIITGYNQGVQCFRVHDIKEVHEALKVQEALNSI